MPTETSMAMEIILNNIHTHINTKVYSSSSLSFYNKISFLHTFRDIFAVKTSAF